MTFMRDLRDHGLAHIRMRNDLVTQRDFKNVLVVWFFQFCLIFFVVLSTPAPLEDIFELQL